LHISCCELDVTALCATCSDCSHLSHDLSIYNIYHLQQSTRLPLQIVHPMKAQSNTIVFNFNLAPDGIVACHKPSSSLPKDNLLRHTMHKLNIL
jgi:hypothetical protein